ncbi:hypothetical protein D3C75_587090 [compost metagenome]
MAKQTTTINTAGGAWTQLVAGECTVAALVANATVSTALISLRVTLSGGTSSYILPMNSLPFNTPNRIAVGGISLKAGDKLEALSSANVNWMVTVVTGAAYKSNIVTAPATDTWTTLVSGPATVRALFTSSPGVGTVSARLNKPSGETIIVLGEEMATGGSKRLMVPIVVATGETIQVKGTSTAYWIATGVE